VGITRENVGKYADSVRLPDETDARVGRHRFDRDVGELIG